MNKIYTRRQFNLMLLGLPLIPALKGCGRRSSLFNPSVVLEDLQKNEAIGRLRSGQITFNYQEIFSERGKEALKIIQRGLFALDLIKSDPGGFRFGIYGPQTTRAVKLLQDRTGIEGNGKRFDRESLLAMEEALQEKIEGRWDPQETKRRTPIPENLALSPTPRESSRRSLLLSIFRG